LKKLNAFHEAHLFVTLKITLAVMLGEISAVVPEPREPDYFYRLDGQRLGLNQLHLCLSKLNTSGVTHVRCSPVVTERPILQTCSIRAASSRDCIGLCGPFLS
jgi:hypothetical protein